MQIVIDMSEEDFIAIRDCHAKSGEDFFNSRIKMAIAIRNGTPLPKGHGELIDKDVVLDMMNHGILEEYITTMGGVIHADR